MKKINLGIILKIQDLELCRNFYRNVLELGQPVMDSNFRVEFQSGDCSVCLVKTAWEEPLPATAGRMAWFFGSGNPDRIQERILACGYQCRCTVAEKAGQQMVLFTDPEGNPFYVPGYLSSQKENDK